jgi:hypothetical protein
MTYEEGFDNYPKTKRKMRRLLWKERINLEHIQTMNNNN